MKKQVSYPTI